MKDFVLLGAGASVDAGLPASFRLTSEISNTSALPEPGRRGGAPELTTALAFAIGTLYQQRGASGINPLATPGVDIEELVDAIDSLAHPELSGATPFVSGWHPFLRDLDAAQEDRGRMVEQFVKNLEKSRRAETVEMAANHSEAAIAALRMALLLGQPRFASVLFRRLKVAIVRRVGEILWLRGAETHSRVQYLQPLLTGDSLQGIATLNYDNTVEACAESLGVHLGTGLEDYSTGGTISFSKDVKVRLLKLHGSLDWTFSQPGERPTDYPGRRALRFNWTRVDPQAPNWDPDAAGIVFGRHKMQTPGPFLDLLQSFVTHLQDADRLIVIGYSFRDEHINRAVFQFLMRRKQADLLIVDPALPERYEVIVDLLGRFPNRVRVWNVTAAEALRSSPITPQL